ncbi:hypothetical protein CHITON_1157 [Thermococcus chitonophagus]|uniref:Uncharacterized protein n=1 Tax=Thermococcus chitonophagus TaxID=54262 RepID=A0A160VTS5_9EURY|nr:hypothetical protein CHITON_1157 [Thermococcus chitonophagus]
MVPELWPIQTRMYIINVIDTVEYNVFEKLRPIAIIPNIKAKNASALRGIPRMDSPRDSIFMSNWMFESNL